MDILGNSSDEGGLRRWLKTEGGIYLGPDKALQAIEAIGARFLLASGTPARQLLIGELRVQAEKTIAAHPDLAPNVKAYVQVVELVSKRGDEWLNKEEKRLQRMIGTSPSANITPERREAFQRRLEAVASMLSRMQSVSVG